MLILNPDLGRKSRGQKTDAWHWETAIQGQYKHVCFWMVLLYQLTLIPSNFSLDIHDKSQLPSTSQAQRLWRRDGVLGGSERDRKANRRKFLRGGAPEATEGTPTRTPCITKTCWSCLKWVWLVFLFTILVSNNPKKIYHCFLIWEVDAIPESDLGTDFKGLEAREKRDACEIDKRSQMPVLHKYQQEIVGKQIEFLWVEKN